jgi:predicted lipoprotein with Yx(FWY)xxD motif
MKIFRSHFAISGVVVVLALFALAACAPAATPAPTTAPQVAPTTAPAATTSAGSATGVTIKLAQIQGFGLFLTDDAGRTLYAFDNDKKDTSNCTGNCLQNWPPFIVRGMPQAGDRITASLISTFTRTDGTTQAEYDGHPLYYYAQDKNPGDVKGHGVGNVWHVLSPRGSPMTNPAPTTAP